MLKISTFLFNTSSVVAYGPQMVKPLHAGPKHQIWYMYSLGQYKHFWMGVPDFEGQGQGQRSNLLNYDLQPFPHSFSAQKHVISLHTLPLMDLRQYIYLTLSLQ